MPSLSRARGSRVDWRAREASKAAKQRASWERMKAAVAAKHEIGSHDV